MEQTPKAAGNKKKKSYPTVGFGVPVGLAPHHFVVSIPRGSRQEVRITEDLGMHAQGGDSQVLDRAVVDRSVWTEISGPVMKLFNQRLKAHNLASGRWKSGDNPVDRLLGKELCILVWALEEVSHAKIGMALRNWMALRPEERWWLFGMTAAATGAPEDKGRGWRAALGYALGDTPEKVIRRPRSSNGQKDKPLKDKKQEMPMLKYVLDNNHENQ